jgi:hypothetical protein
MKEGKAFERGRQIKISSFVNFQFYRVFLICHLVIHAPLPFSIGIQLLLSRKDAIVTLSEYNADYH